MLGALATTLGLRLTAAGRDRRVPLRAGPPLDRVDLAFGGGVLDLGIFLAAWLRTQSPSGVFRLLHPPILGAQARTHAELRSDGVPDTAQRSALR